MDYDVDAITKRAGRLIDAGDLQSLDQALMLLGTGIEKCAVAVEKGKRRKKVKADGTETDTWSRAADDQDEDGVGKRLDNIEEAFDEVIEKLGGGAAPRYPHGSESDRLARENMHAGDVTVPPGRAHVGIVPAMQDPSLHRFDDLIDQVHARDGGSRAAALVAARLENPDTFLSYQKFKASSTTQQQAARSANSGQVGKLAPETHEQAVSGLIAKGFARRLAGSVACNLYGNLPSEFISKGADIARSWQDAVFEIAKRDGLADNLCEAARRARKEQPRLFKAYQSAA